MPSPSPIDGRRFPTSADREAGLVRGGVLLPVIVIGLAGAVGVALLFGRGAGEPDPASLVGPGPTGVEAGVPIGYAPTEAGAVTAALHYDAALHGPAVAADLRHEMLNVLAVDAGAAKALDRYVTRVVGEDVPRDLRGQPTAALRRVPAGYELRSYSDGAARIAVLGVWVSSLADEGLRGGGSNVTELALLWRDGDWRVSAAEAQSGDAVPPERLAEFAEVRYAP